MGKFMCYDSFGAAISTYLIYSSGAQRENVIALVPEESYTRIDLGPMRYQILVGLCLGNQEFMMQHFPLLFSAVFIR